MITDKQVMINKLTHCSAVIKLTLAKQDDKVNHLTNWLDEWVRRLQLKRNYWHLNPNDVINGLSEWLAELNRLAGVVKVDKSEVKYVKYVLNELAK